MKSSTQTIIADLPRLVDEARRERGEQPSPVARYIESLGEEADNRVASALNRAVRRLAAGDPERVAAAIEAVADLCDDDPPERALEITLRAACSEASPRADERLGTRALKSWPADERGAIDERAAARLLVIALLVGGPMGAEIVSAGYACELFAGTVPAAFGAVSPATAAAVIDRLHGVLAVA